MKKIMILGSYGMLGHIVYQYFKNLGKYEIVDNSYPTKLHEKSKLIDITVKNDLENLIISEKPDFIINCIGILIKGSQSDPSKAIYINSYFPHQLAGLLKKTGGKLIQISTDCVFSGTKGFYSEDDYRDADDIYGRSKALGEVQGKNLTLRTSIIGPELKQDGEGLFHWFMKQKSEIKGFSNVFWGGVTTLELAKCINTAIEKELTGLYHVTNNEKISKLELLNYLNEIFREQSVSIIPESSKKSDKSLKTNYSGVFDVKSYKFMINELKDYILDNKQLYSQYL